MNDDIKRLQLEIDKLKLQQNTGDKPKSSFSIGWFIFWLIVFWPIALIMVVYYGFKEK